MPRASLPSVLTVFLAACAAPPRSQLPPDAAPRPVTTLAVFSVNANGHELGTVKKLAIEDPRGRIQLWRVENLDRQYLGFADAEGRFFRHLPFEERESFIGIYPMSEGLKVLFETDAVVTTKALEADFKKGEPVGEGRR